MSGTLSNYIERPRRAAYGTALAGIASRYGPSIVRRYGSRARGMASQAASSLYSQASSYLSRGASARQSRVRASRMRGRSAPPFVGKQIAAGGGGESKSFFTLKKPKFNIGKAMKLLGNSTVGRTTGLSSASTQGLQNATLLNMSWDAADITNAFQTVGEAQTTPANRSAKLLLGACHSKAFITNAESTNVHFTIYDVMCKSDKGTNNVDAAATFLAGFVDQNDGAALNSGYISATPYGNPRFMANYKIMQSTPIILSPGQTHLHTIHYDPQRVINLERLYNNATTSGGIGGVTLQSFIVQHGTPVHDDVTETLVTMGASKLDIVLAESLSYKQLLRDQAYASITTSLFTTLAGFQMAEGTPQDVADAN